jgi:hypothetical protein
MLDEVLTDTQDGDEGAIEDGDVGGERPNDQRSAGRGVAAAGGRFPSSPEVDDGGAGGGAVKVASLPFPSLRSVTAPAVWRGAALISGEGRECGQAAGVAVQSSAGRPAVGVR